MNVLFNNNNEGQAELKELLGFLDLNIKYPSIKSEIQSVTREVKALVGNEVYSIAFNAYKGKNADENLTQLIYYLRYPIAIGAYRLYVPNSDIAHTANGRKMRVTELEKNAFEWMIDRDNEALERKYYRALDDLLLFLEESNIEEWKNSEENKHLKSSLFKTADEFDDFFPIQSRLILMKMLPGIKQCIIHEIKPRIGNLLENILTGIITPDQEEINYYVKQACAYYALSWVLPRFSVQMFPEGVLQKYVSESGTSQSKQVAKLNEVAYAKQSFEEDFNKAISKVEQIMLPTLSNSNEEVNIEVITGTNYISM